jgi:monoamine oxidase
LTSPAETPWSEGEAAMKQRDVVIVGAGLAGLSAAYHLRDLDLEVVDVADEVGGRTKSVWLPNGLWINYGAQYITDDRTHVVALADAVGVELLPYKGFGDSSAGSMPFHSTAAGS